MQKKVGVVAGKFRIFHNGHKEYFYKASLEDLEILYIFISADENLKRPATLMETIQSIGKSMQTLDIKYEIITYDCPAEDFEEYVIEFVGHKDIIGFNLIGKYPINKIEHKQLKITSNVNITTAKIEDDIYNINNYNIIAKEFRTYLNKKVVITGVESCGKTQMSIKLAGILQTEYSSEYGRYHARKFMGGEDKTYLPNQFVHIGMQQNIQDKQRNEQAHRCLIVDTDPIVTLRFLNSYMSELESEGLVTNNLIAEWEQASNFLENMCRTYKSDLTILLAPTVKFVDDGIRWAQDQETRMRNHEELKSLYIKFGIEFLEIKEDTYSARFNKVVEVIEKDLFKIN